MTYPHRCGSPLDYLEYRWGGPLSPGPVATPSLPVSTLAAAAPCPPGLCATSSGVLQLWNLLQLVRKPWKTLREHHLLQDFCLVAFGAGNRMNWCEQRASDFLQFQLSTLCCRDQRGLLKLTSSNSGIKKHVQKAPEGADLGN